VRGEDGGQVRSLRTQFELPGGERLQFWRERVSECVCVCERERERGRERLEKKTLEIFKSPQFSRHRLARAHGYGLSINS
jgi:hypothetical protein